MADSIKIKATKFDRDTGEMDEPTNALEDRELGFHRKEEALYIADHLKRKIKLCQASHAKAMEQLSLLESLPSGATLEQVVAKVNEFLSALKGRGDE